MVISFIVLAALIAGAAYYLAKRKPQVLADIETKVEQRIQSLKGKL